MDKTQKPIEPKPELLPVDTPFRKEIIDIGKLKPINGDKQDEERVKRVKEIHAKVAPLLKSPIETIEIAPKKTGYRMQAVTALRDANNPMTIINADLEAALRDIETINAMHVARMLEMNR